MFLRKILLRKKRRMRGIDRKACVTVPPSAAEGGSFPQSAQTSAEVWESADADAIQRGNQFPLWDPLRSLRGREFGTALGRGNGAGQALSVSSVRGKRPPFGACADSQRFSRNLLSESKPLTLGFDFVVQGLTALPEGEPRPSQSPAVTALPGGEPSGCGDITARAARLKHSVAR